MRKLENTKTRMYKFYLMNHEFAPSQNDVISALDNFTLEDLSPCKKLNSTNSTKPKPMNKSSVCTDVNGNFQKKTTPVVTSAPFIVKTCDQVLYIQGAQKLKNYDDCSSREDGFFTMSMFMVNYFQKDVASTLRKSILIEDMNLLPSYVPGTMKKCLNFVDGKTPGQFAVCFNDPAVTETLYAAFMSFMKCRMGDNLRPLTLPQLKKVYELTCNGQPIDPKLIFGSNKGDLINGINDNLGKLNPYYPIRFPPGGLPPEKRKQRNDLHKGI